MEKEEISLVVPCHNEEEALPYFYREFKNVTGQLEEYEIELILINDGSRDDTLRVMKGLAEMDSCVKYVSLSRNFGKEAAIYAGFEYASGDYIAVLDADLQDPPALLPQMMKEIKNGYDSVATRRVTRKGEPPIRSFFAHCFYKLINRISNLDIVDGARDYRLMTSQYKQAVLQMKE